jgi:hypothetical protein
MAQNTTTVEVEHNSETIEVPTTFDHSDLAAYYGSIPDEIRVDRIFVHDGVVRAEQYLGDAEWVEVGYYTRDDDRPGVDTGWVAEQIDDVHPDQDANPPGETVWERED